MSFAIPTGFTLYGSSNNGDTATYYNDASTASEPYFLQIDRKRAMFDQRTERWSVPQYRLRLFRGLVDTNGTPRPERCAVDLTIRTPVGGEAQLDASLAVLNTVLADLNFVTSVKELKMPG